MGLSRNIPLIRSISHSIFIQWLGTILAGYTQPGCPFHALAYAYILPWCHLSLAQLPGTTPKPTETELSYFPFSNVSSYSGYIPTDGPYLTESWGFVPISSRFEDSLFFQRWQRLCFSGFRYHFLRFQKSRSLWAIDCLFFDSEELFPRKPTLIDNYLERRSIWCARTLQMKNSDGHPLTWFNCRTWTEPSWRELDACACWLCW